MTAELASSRAHHDPRVPSELYDAGSVVVRSMQSQQDSNHPVQRLHHFVGNAVLGDLRKLEQRLRVDDRGKAGEVARAVFGVEGFVGRLFSGGGGRAWACLIVF
jgi:hypothetical protein